MGQVHIGYEGFKNKSDKRAERIVEVPVIVEKIIEVPVEKIIYLNSLAEQVEKIVFQDRVIEVEKVITVYENIPVETIHTVEVIKEVPVYTEKYITVEKIKEVINTKLVIPTWVYPVIGLESLAIVLLALFK